MPGLLNVGDLLGFLVISVKFFLVQSFLEQKLVNFFELIHEFFKKLQITEILKKTFGFCVASSDWREFGKADNRAVYS